MFRNGVCTSSFLIQRDGKQRHHSNTCYFNVYHSLPKWVWTKTSIPKGFPTKNLSLPWKSSHWSPVGSRNDVVSGIKLGTFGREEGSMVRIPRAHGGSPVFRGCSLVIPNIRVYMMPKDSLWRVGWPSPNIRSLDPGTCESYVKCAQVCRLSKVNSLRSYGVLFLVGSTSWFACLV